MRKKRNRCAGESLVETLMSMLTLSLGILMLSGAIGSSARLHNRTAEMYRPKPVEPQEFEDMDLSDPSSGSFIQVRNGKGTVVIEAFSVTVTENQGSFYYEKSATEYDGAFWR